MQRIKISNNFYLDEYIPKYLYEKYVQKPHILQGLIDKRLIVADQMLRDYFGHVTINNWWNGGERNWSGLRTAESPYYSQTSQHTYGRASDKIFSVGAEEVRSYIQLHWWELGINCIEADVSWVHSDVRWWTGNELLIVKP